MEKTPLLIITLAMIYANNSASTDKPQSEPGRGNEMECSCTVNCSFDDLYFDPDTIIIDKGKYQSPREIDCDECGRTMEPNEKHYRTLADHEEDGIVSYRQCKYCSEIISVFFEDYPLGGVWEMLDDQIRSGDIVATEYCISQLSRRNRDRVCATVEHNWKYEEMDEAENRQQNNSTDSRATVDHYIIKQGE